jgi:hypothetical protein
MSQILFHFPGFGEEKVAPFLRMMVDKRLMFKEGDRYLSLAVPARTSPPRKDSFYASGHLQIRR